ncbi:glycosyltransferase family 2 protein [Methylothermus subterraneus]
MISIVICTYNRAEILADTLKSFLACERAGIDHEVLVVDNNSQDNTREVVQQFIDRDPTIGYLQESMQGLSHARNRGIRCATGKIIAFVDDDVYFSPNWLTELEETFGDPEVACMGGKSIPLFEDGKPPWLTEDILPVYGSTRSGEASKLMQYPEHPFGLNMAFRREVFETVGLFNPKLGRIGKNLLSNEESELFWRIHRAGLKVAYNPNAIIYHRIPKERATPEWVLRRYYWQGRSEAVMDRIVLGQSRLQILSKLTDKFVTTLRPTLKGVSWTHPKRSYWQLAAMPLSRKISWYYLAGYLQQVFTGILSIRN